MARVELQQRYAGTAQDSRVSLLFPGGAPEQQPEPPDCFGDLNLDQVDDWLAKNRDAFTIHRAFRTLLEDPRLINFRLDVFDDLADGGTARSLTAFNDAMRMVRRLAVAASKSEDRHVAEGFLMRAIGEYVTAVRAVGDDLDRQPIRSAGLVAVRDYLAGYQRSEGFQRMARDNEDLDHRLQEVHYALRIRGDKVTVTPEHYAGDYSAEVLATFERFRQADAEDHLVKLTRTGIGHIEAIILGFVARQNEELFNEVASHVQRQARFLDPVVDRVDHELEFYLSYLAMMRELTANGLPFSRPVIRDESDDDHVPRLHVVGGFDLALALKGEQVITNDVRMGHDQQFVIVTGPNQGGKTTFARMIGEIHYLAGLGCPVPGESVLLRRPDKVLTHFERQEDRERETGGGKLEDDLVRVREVLQRATDRTVVVINEMFASTTLSDAGYLGGKILDQLGSIGSTVIWVTFVEDLARRGSGTVSMVSQVRKDDPTVRTFKILPQPPAGKIYAEAIAARHKLRREDVLQRIGDRPDAAARDKARGSERGSAAESDGKEAD